MAPKLHALTVSATDPEDLAVFWASLLGWERDGLDVVPGEAMPLRLAFAATDLQRTGLNQMHLHLTSNTTSQDETVARVLALGGTHLDVGQLPEEDHVVVADPGGNEFCVIEAGNSWLAATNFLDEVAADGTREVGLFWAASRSTGGTGRTGCTSCWSRTTSSPRWSGWQGKGASVTHRFDDYVEMADPDGNGFVLRAW